ncbi:ATP-binding protein [Flavobacterium filum]|uniref:ATP-binding protein n=1 Tax=Flavobacterium filum TaxID=370974 RepID=UPI0023EFF943|nr:ATP-binding protein [Flavobacterium filum]
MNNLKKWLFKGKTLLLIGPRQVGKTTLVKTLLAENEGTLFLDGDDSEVRELLSKNNKKLLERIIGVAKMVFIDEAQRINHIGLTAKIIHDNFKEVQLILSGSSVLDLNQAVSESLTGRKITFHLYPLSYKELSLKHNFLEMKEDLENRILFGNYPDIVVQKGNEKLLLKELTESYLYKDILALSNIKKPEILHKLVQALAYQIGSEVSLNEMANLLGISKETVASYIELLEKAFVIFSVRSFSRNLRNEIKANQKIYFYDTGVRNAVINNFNPIQLRNDKGALWENYVIAERIKFNHYRNHFYQFYFWRTTEQQEIDWIEESDGQLSAFEFKWQNAAKAKLTKTFANAYPNHSFKAIDKENYWEFVM